MHRPPALRAAAPLLITLLAFAGTRAAAAADEMVTIPAGTVVHATLDQPLSSATAKLGQRVTATLHPGDLGGFPIGTRFEGIVTETSPVRADYPGTLGVRWYAVVLPNPETVPLDGRLYSLSPEYSWRTPQGRLVDRRFDEENDDDDGFDWKWVGYGAGGGALLGTILGGSFLEGALLGGLGGALYGAIRGDVFTAAPSTGLRLAADERGRRTSLLRDAQVQRGEPFGIRLDRPVRFTARRSFRYASPADAQRGDRVLGAREELINTSVVRIDGRPVQFARARPTSINGVLYVPMDALGGPAGIRVEHAAGTALRPDYFTLQTRHGPVQCRAGSRFVTLRERVIPMRAAPMVIDGQLFVPLGFFSRISGMPVSWDPSRLQVDVGAAA